MLAVSAAAYTGCGTKMSAPPSSAPHDGTYNARNIAPFASPVKTDSATVANHLEKLATSINGVRGANCVVFGKYAIVGIDVDPKMERSRVGTVKYAVAEAFRKDRYGIDALVTADIDMAQRLREIRADIRNGRPVAGFAEELADIVGRLVPQIPRNIVPPSSPENTGAPAARPGQR